MSSELNKLKEAETAYEADEMEAAITAFLALADEGIPEACRWLGLIYRTGDGVAKDESAADLWYSRYVFLLKAHSQAGSKAAMYDLAKLYQYGEHVTKNEAKALKIFTELAEDGHRESQFSLATFFRHGWCQCDVNNEQYTFWLRESAEGGHPEAMYYYGLLLIDDGDVMAGRQFISNSADNGFWLAQDYLQRSTESDSIDP